MQYYDITINAGKSRNLDAVGSYFYYYSGSAGGNDPSITIKEDQRGTSIILKPGQGFKMEPGQTASMWRITNTVAGSSIVGVVVVGHGEIWDNTITGTVNSVDNGKARTMANMAFMCSVTLSSVAGNNQHTQLFNPAGSNKNIVLESFSNGSSVSGVAYSGQYNTLMATNQLLGPLNSKNTNGVASVGYRASQSNVGLLFTPNFSSFISANQQFIVNLREPMVISPGYGYAIAHSALAADILCQFEYFEEPI